MKRTRPTNEAPLYILFRFLLVMITLWVLAAVGASPIAAQNSPCQAIYTGTYNGLSYAVFTSGTLSGSACTADDLSGTIAACLSDLEAGGYSELDVRALLSDCVKGTYPDTTLVAGVSGAESPLLLNANGASQGLSADCRAHPFEDTSLSDVSDGIGGIFTTLKSILIFTPYVEAYEEYVEAHTERLLSDEPGTRSPREEAALQNLLLVTEAAKAADDAEIDAEGWVETVVGWIFGGNEGKEIDPNAESACQQIAAFFADCDLSEWSTSPCQIMLTRVRNPDCNPLVAYTTGERACAAQEFSEEELQSAVSQVEVNCWSLVTPGSDTDNVCTVSSTVPTGGFVIAYLKTQKQGCENPIARTDESCTEPIDLDTALNFLLESETNLLDVLTKLEAPPPGPGGFGPE